jgi:hypothetical protein
MGVYTVAAYLLLEQKSDACLMLGSIGAEAAQMDKFRGAGAPTGTNASTAKSSLTRLAGPCGRSKKKDESRMRAGLRCPGIVATVRRSSAVHSLG